MRLKTQPVIRQIFLLLTTVLSQATCGLAQEVIVFDTLTHTNLPPTSNIAFAYKYELGICGRTGGWQHLSYRLDYVEPDGTTSAASLYYLDGTLGPDNNYYSINIDHPRYPPGHFIRSGRLTGGGVVDLASPLEATVPFGTDTVPLGIATDYSGLTYSVGDGVSRYNVLTGAVTYLETLPPEFKAGAQMAFLKGSFYYPNRNKELVQLKVRNDEAYYQIVGSLPDTINYGGLFAVPTACNEGDLYIVNNNTNSSSTIYRIDLDNVDFEEICLYGGSDVKGNAISAMHLDEATFYPCDIELDLATENDATTDRFLEICAPDVRILEDSLFLTPEMEYDSIVVEITGSLDGVNETLSLFGGSGVSIVGNNTARVAIHSSGFAETEDYLPVLETLIYNNLSTFSPGLRTITITAFHPFHGEVSAQITIDLSDDNGDLFLTSSTITPSCSYSGDGSITVFPEGGLAPYEISWQGGESGAVLDGAYAGQYQATITDVRGCQAEELIELLAPDSLIVGIASDQDSVCAMSGTLVSVVSGGTYPYEYGWNGTPGDSILTDIGPGNFELIVTDVNNCVAMASHTLYPASIITDRTVASICEGETYNWRGMNFSQDTLLCEEVISPDACDTLFCLELAVVPSFYALEEFELCNGESLTIRGLTFSQDTIINWGFQTIEGCDSVIETRINNLATYSQLDVEICEGDFFSFGGQNITSGGIYQETLENAAACDSIVELTLTVHPLPVVEIMQQGSLCSGEEVVLSVEGDFPNINWSDGNLSSSIIVTTTGEYGVTATDNNGCINEAFVTLTDDPPLVDFRIDHPQCPDGEGRLEILNVSGGVPPYQIEPTGQIVATGDFVAGIPIGNQVYSLQDATGCATPLVFQIIAENELTVDMPEELSMKLGESLPISVTTSFAPDLISWTPSEGLSCVDCLSPLASPTETTRYFLYLEDANDCSWEGNIVVKIEVPDLYVPNAFSPNGDGSNDVFRPAFNNSVANITAFSVYDRWGAQVFVATDTHTGWDGLIDGQFAPQGVYVYFVEWVDKAGKNRLEMGEVVLLR